MNSFMLTMFGLMTATVILAVYAPLEYKYAAIIPMLAMFMLVRLFIWRRR